MPAPIIKIKRSAIPGKKPSVNDLNLGELALNTYDGNLFAKRVRAGINTDIINIGAGATVTNVLYVTEDGNDENTGKKLGDAKATIKGAVAAAEAGTIIKISAGTYIENNPIVLGDNVSIVGDSLREVTVTPQNQADLFHVGKGNYIANMSFVGPPNPNAIITFDPVELRYIDQSPYIQNCTNFISDSIGLKVDGSYALGPLKSMVLDSYTQYNQGGIGASMTNEGYAQLVSLFTICDNIAVYCGTGGGCDLTNSNSSFGNYGLVSDGTGPLKYTGVISSGSIENSDTFVVDLNVPTYNIINAEYSNTTGVLTAYTSTPHNFSVGMGVTLVGLGFTCDFEPGIRTYPSGQKGYVFEIKTVSDGRYLDAGNSILSNKREIQDKSLASISLNYPDFYFPGDAQTTVYSRYKDSYRLIQKNKQEIVDKSLASIAIGFPSAFNFPTDPYPYEQNRYYDASRLIQINKQEIVDKSLASVAIAHSDFYFPGDSQTNSRSRYYDAYRLIQNNKSEIVGTAWTNTYNVYPGISSTMNICKRDLGFFIDAVSTDIFTGGNNYSKEFTLQYFTGSGAGYLNGEVTETNYAFVQARQLMNQAITNQLTFKDLTVSVGPSTYSGGGGNITPNTNTASCADVQSNINNLVGIITSSIGAGNTSSLPSTNLGNFTTGGTKCARDIGYLVDAISTDIFTGGNKYARDFTLQYFDVNGSPISNGLAGETTESITAFNAVRSYAKKALTNQLNVKNIGINSGPGYYGGGGGNISIDLSGNANSCADVQLTVDTLTNIVTNVIGSGSTAALSTFSENLGISTTNKCARDLGYFVDAIATDLFISGNIYAINFTKQYFNGNTPINPGLIGEESESIYAFESARDQMKKAINNQLNFKDLTVTADPSPQSGISSNTNPYSCTNVRNTLDTLTSIVTQTISAGNLNIINSINENMGIFQTGEAKCYRDIGYVIDALAADVSNSTNKNIIEASTSYFNKDGTPISGGLVGEESQSIAAFNAVRDYSKLAINNLLNYQNLSLIADPNTGSNKDSASCSDVQTNIDNLISILTTTISNGNLSNIPSVYLPSQFTVNVGVATQRHYYNSGGTVAINAIRPFDGQVVYFGDLYYTVGRINVSYGGTGYLDTPVVVIEDPITDFGVTAQAVAEIKDGSILNIDMVSSGRGYTYTPKITISNPDIGINRPIVTPVMVPTYYSILSSTPVSSGICTITINENVPYVVGVGTEVPFYKQSRVLASGHSFEYIGSGTEISKALPSTGGVPIQDNETDARFGGLVVFTSTDQSGNFRIGDGVAINQQTGTISGTFYSKSLFSTLTPFILALGGE